MKTLFTLIFLNCLLFVCSCGPTTAITGGGGSETTNSITVCVKEYQVSGKAASGADVELYRETFNPIVEILPDSLKKEADLTGRFVFPPISNGVYNIYSTYDSADFFTRALFITSIRVPSDTVLEQRYFSPGKFEVVLIKESQAPFTATVVSAQFYLKGSPFYSLQDLVSTDHYTFDDVPIAKYNCDIRIIASMGSRYVKFEYPDSVEVKNALGGPPNGDQVIIYAKSDTMEAVPHSLYKQ